MTGSRRLVRTGRRHMARFRLRWLFLFVAALGALFAWIAPSIHRELAWRRAVDPVRRAGGSVAWFANTERCPDTAASISLNGSEITDAELNCLSKFRNAKTLLLAHTSITNAGLKHLASMRSLEWVDLRGTPVTKTAVEELRRALPNTKIAH